MCLAAAILILARSEDPLHNLITSDESHEAFANRAAEGKKKRIRLLKLPPNQVQNTLAQAAYHFHAAPVMANGRLELLHLLRETSISRDYHRYGNLGIREKEKRRPLPGSPEEMQFNACYPEGSLRELCYLAFPLMLSCLSVNMTIFIDRLLLAQYSTAALNADHVDRTHHASTNTYTIHMVAV